VYRPGPDAEPHTMVVAWKPGNPSPWIARYVDAAKRWSADQQNCDDPASRWSGLPVEL
jgi:hypothetical protein